VKAATIALLVLTGASQAQQTSPDNTEQQAAPASGAKEAPPTPGGSGGATAARKKAAADVDAIHEGGTEEADPQAATLTGNWGGLRSAWRQQGFFFEGSWIVETSKVIHGGRRPGTTTQDWLDLNAAADLDTLWGWSGTTAAVEVWTKHGQPILDDVGDWQGTSDIGMEPQTENAALWIETWLVPGSLRLKVGKVDANDEFAVVNGAAEFLNDGMAASPAIEPIPSAPDPAWSVNLVGYPTDDTWIGAGVYDGATQAGIPTGSHGIGTFLGQPSDLFLITEAGCHWSRDASFAGSLGLGGWKHTGEFADFEGGSRDGAGGMFAVLDQKLWRESPQLAGDGQGIAMFAQGAVADDRVSSVRRHLATGFTWTGLLPGRDDEVLGIGTSWAQFSGDSGAGFTRDSELALEVFYKLQSRPWMSIKPDLQYVVHPGGDALLDNAWVATLRFEFVL
jgi:porin